MFLIETLRALRCLKMKQVSGSLTTVTANFVKIICIASSMLTRLMTNPFLVNPLIHLKFFTNLFLQLFILFFLFNLFVFGP